MSKNIALHLNFEYANLIVANYLRHLILSDEHLLRYKLCIGDCTQK